MTLTPLDPVTPPAAPAPPPAWQTLHGAVLRPPIMRWDGMLYTGALLAHLDSTAAQQLPGVVKVVRHMHFVGAVASQQAQAKRACALLDVRWQDPVDSAAPAALTSADTAGPAAKPAHHFQQHYSWQDHTTNTTAPFAIAHYDGQQLQVWACLQRPDLLRTELAQLCRLSPDAIQIFAQGTGPDAHDTALDAALLSRHVSRPVRVVSNDNPSNACIDIHWQAHTDTNGNLLLNARSSQPGGRRPGLAALLCGVHYHTAAGLLLQADTHHEHPPQLAISSVDVLPDPANDTTARAQVFARESFLDEYWHSQGRDPVQARLANLDDETGRALINAVTQHANWDHTRRNPSAGQGIGFAYAHVIDDRQQPPSHVWSAWVAEVAVDQASGDVSITRLTVGHEVAADNATPHTPDSLEHSLRTTAERLLHTPGTHDTWGDTPDLPATLPALADVQLVRHDNTAVAAPLCWHQGAELPAAAAIANAIHDATGLRVRNAPFDTQALQAQLRPPAQPSPWKKRAALLGGMGAAIGGALLAALPWRPAIAPLAAIDTSIYSEQAIARGRLVAIAGDCMVCHTATGGLTNTGGRPLDTPFGTIYTTNITPDRETGIGTWSYQAFERAMRQGIHQDGRHLYPAFPYTAFAKISDADMQALYAYLMTQEPVSYRPPESRLAFPYNLRPAMAGWNLLFHDATPYTPDPDQTTLWNRGAYLVQGAGHCAACHSPRNALGAEKQGQHFLAGGLADGWEAPALNAHSKAPIPWTESSLYDYLRTGYSALHGVAAGPMAPVVQGLAQLPDDDIRAMSHYLASLLPSPESDLPAARVAAQLEQQSRDNQAVLQLPGERLFEGACAMCHDTRDGAPLFGARPSLALNSNLHSDLPDNVIQVLLHGIDNPALPSLGYMPGFGHSMNNQQLEDLLVYMRLRFAPDKPAWQDLPEKIQTIRQQPPH